MTDLSRHKVLADAAASAASLGVAASAKVASSGNLERPPKNRINTKSPTSLNDPGPPSATLASQFPSFQNPPATNVNGMPLCWTSFNNAHRRYQNGGWAGEVTQDDFAISEDISGVSMCLAANGVREMHWHQQAKWAIMVDGKALSRSRSDT
jgi:oxalate decarboxylase